MKLFYRKFGQGAPIIVLHGLYGSSDNWVTIGRALSENYEVWLLDQRNHGRSPHSPEHDYDAMKADLLEFMNDHELDKAILIGHSMGGKTVMQFAIDYPERVNHLIVVDIAPKSYLFSLDMDSDNLNHKKIMEAMLSVDFTGLTQRTEVDDLLIRKIRSHQVRQFLLKNVKRNDDKSFGWVLNINALYNNLEKILISIPVSGSGLGDEVTGFPVLFIKGANSDYITADDRERIEGIFPYAEFQVIQNAGHWLHAEQPADLLKVIHNFLQ